MLVWVIIGCEVGFWVLLAAGLAARYVLKLRVLSTILLFSVMLLDVVLLIASIVDMRNGATGGIRHGLAAAYIGYSVMFGHATVRWADQRVAHRFAGGPPPVKPPKYGAPRVRYEAVLMVKILAAWGIAWATTGLLVFLVGDTERTAPVVAFAAGLAKVVIICAVVSAFEIAGALKKRNPSREDPQGTATPAAGSGAKLSP